MGIFFATCSMPHFVKVARQLEQQVPAEIRAARPAYAVAQNIALQFILAFWRIFSNPAQPNQARLSKAPAPRHQTQISLSYRKCTRTLR